jgi:hypothetical protein
MVRFSSLVVLAAIACSQAHAVILFGGDNLANRTDPTNGVPWTNVGAFANGTGGWTGSGVYLGNRYVLTAHHVTLTSQVTFDGATFHSVEGSTTPLPGVDLRLVRLASDPGLPRTALTAGTSEIGVAGYIVGWGVGRNPAVPTNTALVAWGDATTAAKRWGTNVPKGVEAITGTYDYDSLVTVLGTLEGANEAALTLFDSGAALFQEVGGLWRLSGIGTSVDTQGSSFFGLDAIGGPGDGERNYFVRIGAYADAILSIVHPPPVIAYIAPSPTNVLLSVSNLTESAGCIIETAPSPTSAAWTTNGSFVATSATTNVSVGSGGEPTLFYRIRSSW